MKNETRYLEAFYHAARLLSFTKAANELRIAVSAISRQIKLLEKQVGHELFVRGTRSVVLTAHGERYHQLCKDFFEALQSIKHKRPQAQLRVGMLQSHFETLMRAGFAEFLQPFEGYVEFYINSPQRLAEMLRDRNIDLTLSNEPSFLPGFKAVKLARERMVCVFSRTLRASVTAASVAPTTRCIVCTPFERYWQRSPVEPQRVIRINSVTGAMELVKSGLGISIVPAGLVKNMKELDSFPIKGLHDTIYLNTLNTFEASPAFKSFYRFLRTQIQKPFEKQ